MAPRQEPGAPEVEVRSLAVGDIPSLVPVLEDWFNRPGAADGEGQEVASIIRAMEDSRNGSSLHQYLVATSGEEVIGLIGLTPVDESALSLDDYSPQPTAEIASLAVATGYQGQGVGTRLFKAASELARHFGCTRIVMGGLEPEIATDLEHPPVRYAVNGWFVDLS